MSKKKKDLQTVLDEMLASAQADKVMSFDEIRAWQKRYPQFTKEIAEAVSDWREFQFFALAGIFDEIENDTFLDNFTETRGESPLPAEVLLRLKGKTEPALTRMGLPLTVDLTYPQQQALEEKRVELETMFSFYYLRAGLLVVTHKREDIRLECGNDFLRFL